MCVMQGSQYSDDHKQAMREAATARLLTICALMLSAVFMLCHVCLLSASADTTAIAHGCGGEQLEAAKQAGLLDGCGKAFEHDGYIVAEPYCARKVCIECKADLET